MRILYVFAAMLLTTAVVTGCSTVSKQDYAFARTELSKPAVRKQAINRCVAMNHWASEAEKANVAALMNVTPSKANVTFCTRLLKAWADGRISYEDYAKAERSLNIAPFIKVLRN